MRTASPSVAGLVAPAISRAEIERARRKRPDSLDTYDLYLQALPLFRTIDVEGYLGRRQLVVQQPRKLGNFGPCIRHCGT